jgi:hypothetical protein
MGSPEVAGGIDLRTDSKDVEAEKFAKLNRMILGNLNKNTRTPTFYRYTKEEIIQYMADPYKNEKMLREAVNYIYGASTHFHRLIEYFVSLSDFSFVVSPYRIDPKTVNKKTLERNYRKVLNSLSAMSIKTQFPKILRVCLREDIFYGTMWVTQDDILIQQLPSDYCKISSIEGNVLNVAFNFTYFNRHPELLEFYPPEFEIKYKQFKEKRLGKWIELDAPTSFAVKCNNDILEYPIPPFIGILPEIYDLEDYKQLKLTRTAIENYALLVMNLPMNKDSGEMLIPYERAYNFWHNLDEVMPDEVGSVLSPMGIDKISFERSNNGDEDTIADAEQNLFTAAGVSSLLFNNEKASANALLLSIKADQAITFGIVKSIEDVVNRFIRYQNYGKNFKVTFLDVSPYNRKEAGDAYLKACQYSVPMISYYCASQGLGQGELDSMSFLETKVLGLQDMFRPLRSSSTLSSSDNVGRPEEDVDELTESGERHREEA